MASPPAALRQMARPAEVLGWWQVAISFVIATYYAVIIAWAVRYVGFSADQEWGDDPEGFLFGSFLKASEAPGFVSGYVSGVLWPLIAVWVVVLVILGFGIRRGRGGLALAIIRLRRHPDPPPTPEEAAIPPAE